MLGGSTASDRRPATGSQEWDALLRQEPPRVVPRSLRARALRGERRWQVSLAVVAITCTVFAVAFFPWPITDDIRLDLGAATGKGVVLGSVYANRTVGDDVVLRKSLVFRVRFRFDDGRAREYEAASLFLGHLAPGTEIEVEFLPSNPAVARVKDGFFVPGGLWEVWWSVAFFVPPLFGFWRYRRWRGHRLALLTHGVPAPGVIERVWQDDPQNEARGWIELSYPAEGGTVRLSQTAEGETYRRACAIVEDQLPVRVLHAPHAPRQHLVLELVD